MPAPTQASYEISLDFTNDTHDCATIQLLRDYGRSTSAIVLLHPGESVTLVLDAGSVYKYALKSRTKVANVSARSWRDIRCDISQLFSSAPSSRTSQRASPTPFHNGVTVDRLWRDYRFNVWNDSPVLETIPSKTPAVTYHTIVNDSMQDILPADNHMHAT